MKIVDYANRRIFLALSLALLAAGAQVALPREALAEASYPNRPVRIVLPLAAGGVGDTTARIIAEKLGDKLGQRFYVENQPGGGGIAAARTVISSPPDGYTLALLTNGTAISVSLFAKLPYDPLKDFAPISSLGFFDFIFCTGAATDFKTLADFIAAAKAKPGALNVGTINIGSTQNLSAELFKTAANIDFTIIPYRGTPEVEVSLLQGNIALMIDSYSAIKGDLADGKFRALASSGSTRSESTPDLATVQETGVANYDVVSWNALFAPARTPPEIVKKLNGALQDILADAGLKKRLIALGIDARASTPEEIASRLKSDIDKWRQVIEKANIPKQ
ncbi:MAG TPA: tripartite tricarboxylate transporter substrate binding protein [Bradyrhizobium sp.]|nr:tripartite tricarboxylate transporter substrate binding protein [Bradyrhizobium sp.]